MARKRYRHEQPSPVRNPNHPTVEKPFHHSSSNPPTLQTQQQQVPDRPSFPSYVETPNLPPKTKLLCEIVATTHSSSVEKALDDTGLRVSQEDVENVLKLSYSFPSSAVKFFRWAGFQLNDQHSPYAWNLVVDLLGKNRSFEAMWEAVKSMKNQGMLSLATFASVFSSYVSANRVGEAVMTFEVMDQYGVPRDIVALNSLLSAICRDGKTADAANFLQIVKARIRPDIDTYAILLEGWETEGDILNARRCFGEMFLEVGWNPTNVPAYDSYLCTLLRGPEGLGEALKGLLAVKDKGCYPGIKFFRLALDLCVNSGDARTAGLLWDLMAGRNGCRPDTGMYNSMVILYCYQNQIEMAKRLLDEMVINGVFPDSQTYNVIFQFLTKTRKLREAWVIFNEMTKNECIPSHANCSAAVKVFVDTGEHYMATRIWKCMIENYQSDLEETGNYLVLRLRDQDRLQEAVKYAEDMIERGIKVNSSTLSKLKQGLDKHRKLYVYDDLLRKWKAR